MAIASFWMNILWTTSAGQFKKWLSRCFIPCGPSYNSSLISQFSQIVRSPQIHVLFQFFPVFPSLTIHTVYYIMHSLNQKVFFILLCFCRLVVNTWINSKMGSRKRILHAMCRNKLHCRSRFSFFDIIMGQHFCHVLIIFLITVHAWYVQGIFMRIIIDRQCVIF